MLHNDGKFEIYIIQHNYERKGIWNYSGDCGQWIAHAAEKVTKTYAEKCKFINNHKKLMNPLTACGSCWQQTGVHGTYNYDEAVDLAKFISKYNQDHGFRVCKLNIEQKRVPLVTFE